MDPLLRLGDTLKEAGEPDEQILKELRIRPEWMDRFPSELSGGELQRFCLARALRPETAFLLCDEITAMLDLVNQARIWEFLIRESKEKRDGHAGRKPQRGASGKSMHKSGQIVKKGLKHPDTCGIMFNRDILSVNIRQVS